jgi:pimeloyl-ACP methyl ester carboxylesterase
VFPDTTMTTRHEQGGRAASRSSGCCAGRDHKNIVHWSEFDRGGHWSAHDAPDLLIEDIREFFGKLGS